MKFNESQHPRDQFGHWIYKEVKTNLKSLKADPLYKKKSRKQLADIVRKHRKYVNERQTGRKIAALVNANRFHKLHLKEIAKNLREGFREQGIIQPKISNKDLSKLIGSIKLQKLYRVKMATKTALKGLGRLSHNV